MPRADREHGIRVGHLAIIGAIYLREQQPELAEDRPIGHGAELAELFAAFEQARKHYGEPRIAMMRQILENIDHALGRG